MLYSYILHVTFVINRMLHTSQVLTINEIKHVWQKKKEKEKRITVPLMR